MVAGFQPRHLVAVVAFDGVVLGDLAAPCEVFGRVQRGGRGHYQVRVCSAAREVRTDHVTMQVPWRLASLRRADTVIVPGIDDLDRPIPAELVRAIRAAGERGARIASVCSGAFVLAATGLLDGKRATTHWRASAELARRYPSIAVDPDVLYVDNGQLLTSAGAAAAFDLCLHLVRCDLGADVAADAARDGVMPLERAGGQAQFIAHEPPGDDGASLAPLLHWLEQNLEARLSLTAIARRAAMSTRTLSRHFREQTGATPAQWVNRARVRRAQRLLETTDLSVERIAAAVGFGSTAVLRDRFGQVVGTSPQAYRRSFGLARDQGRGRAGTRLRSGAGKRRTISRGRSPARSANT
jgi:transcriptional regulator GlxA family with amidase domain